MWRMKAMLFLCLLEKIVTDKERKTERRRQKMEKERVHKHGQQEVFMKVECIERVSSSWWNTQAICRYPPPAAHSDASCLRRNGTRAVVLPQRRRHSG